MATSAFLRNTLLPRSAIVFVAVVIGLMGISQFRIFDAHAAMYYVDSAAGLDSNNGTGSSTPWQTIAKVNNTGLNPGDSVLFKNGDIWREQLLDRFSGSSRS